MVTLPYYLLHDRNTRSRIAVILHADAGDEDDLLRLIQKWLDKKGKEVQYVQVAVCCTVSLLSPRHHVSQIHRFTGSNDVFLC